MTRRPMTGLSAILFAVAFNIPYSLLAATYDYPDILRRPATEALGKFAEGGPALVLIWYGFALSALAFVPLSIALSVTPKRLSEVPALAIGALITGALAGVTQAIGLLRWVFVVPVLAQNPDSLAAQASFDLINAYGGVAIGEHLGQILTVLFIGLMAAMQWREARKLTATMGGLAATFILAGTGEGLSLALGASGEAFALVSIAGFMGLTLWLITTGAGLMRKA